MEDLSETQWFESFVVLRSTASSLSRVTLSPLRINRPPPHFRSHGHPYPSPQAHQHYSRHLGSYRPQERCCRRVTRETPHQLELMVYEDLVKSISAFTGVPLTVVQDPTVAVTDFEGCDRFSVAVVVG